jgi:hypothetical protein
MIEDFNEFCEKMRPEDFDEFVDVGKKLGIVSYRPDMDVISWTGFPHKADGTIKPQTANGDFWYYIEFADHSLSLDHIRTSIDEARELAIKVADSFGYRWENYRKRLLIICQHDEHAADLRRKINDNFPHDSPEQSDNPPVFVIRWLDVVRAHNKKKICRWCDREGHLKMKDCILNRCDDCCRERCSSIGRHSCRIHKGRQRLHDDWVHRSDYG